MKREVTGAALVMLSRLAAMPRTPWQTDELAIMAALQGTAPEPRYPLYVGLSKVAYLLIGDPFISLMVVNVLAAAGTFITLYLALRAMLRDENVAAGAALIFSLSAGFVVQSSAALPESLAMFFVASMLYAFAHARDLSLGVCASLAIGCIPELAFAVVPALLVAALLRRRFLPIAAFAIASLLWGVAWIEGGGGFVVPHVDLHGITRAVPRFALHPWGGKLITAPLLLCALAGAYVLARRFDRKLLPLLVFAVMSLGVTILTADPDLAIRPAVPSMLLVALLAAMGLSLPRKPLLTLGGSLALALLSFAYVWPLVRERATRPSPIAAAAALANRTLHDNAVIVHYGESVAAVHALLPRFEQMPVDEALRRFTGRPDVTIVALYNGTSKEPEAQVFTSLDTDVHRKMLGSASRSATLDPVRPPERYAPIRQAYNFERTPAGLEWRWLGRDAAIRLSPRHAASGTITLRLSEVAPFDRSTITVGDSRFVVTKQPATYSVSAPNELVIRSGQSFVPANIKPSADRRVLAVQLLDVEF